MRIRFLSTLAVGVLVLVGTLCTDVTAQTQTQAARTKNDYNDPKTWLCRPGRKDACSVDINTTVIEANGKLKQEKFTANSNAPIDCFYVYPTVSLDQTPNSDMNAGPEEESVIKSQTARFGSQCRVFAPLYRQITLTALRAGISGRPVTPDRAMAYEDVLDAWNHYLKNDNKGRGVVLIGHSQGSGMLTQLIRNEIDGKPIQSQIISALLIGTNIAVPKGKLVGGAFKSMPLCKSSKETGCVVTYVSFRETTPPPANTRFGKVQGEGMEAGCVNPAALTGGKLHSYLSSSGRTATERPWVTPEAKITTPFVSVPGLLSAECVSNEKGSYLSIKVHGNPSDPRVDEIGGDVVTNGQVSADWGLHLIDVNLAMGNLVQLVADQSRAYLAGKKHQH